MGLVLADSAYGNDFDFRAALRSRRLGYAVAVEPNTVVWLEDLRRCRCRAQRSAGTSPPPSSLGRSCPPVFSLIEVTANRCRRPLGARLPGVREPRGHRLPASLWSKLGLRTDGAKSEHPPRSAEWLLIQWPKDATEPSDYWMLWDPTHCRPLPAFGRPCRPRSLEDRTRLPRTQRRARPRSLRGSRLARLAPPRHPRLPGVLFPAQRTSPL